MLLRIKLIQLIIFSGISLIKIQIVSGAGLECRSIFPPEVKELTLISGGRLKGGRRVNSLGEQGGAFYASVRVGGEVVEAIETRINDYYIDLGSFDTETRQADALEAASLASRAGFSPQFYGYMDVKLKHGEIVRYLYYKEFGYKENAASDKLGVLRGSWNISSRIHDWLIENLGEGRGQGVFDLVKERYWKIHDVHPDPHNENFLVGLFYDSAERYYVRVEAVDWTHWMSYPLKNKTIPNLQKILESGFPIYVGQLQPRF